MNTALKLLLALLLMVPAALAAQEDDPLLEARRKQLEAMKVAFFTRKLSLDANEAKRFWPVYDEYVRLQESNRMKMRQLQGRMRNEGSVANDRELEGMVNEYIRLRTEEANLMARYHPQFMEVLPVRKVMALYRAEEEWKMKLVEELRARRVEQQGGAGPSRLPYRQ
jgi:hypothetical protein